MIGRWGTLTVILATTLVAGFGAEPLAETVAGSAAISLCVVLAVAWVDRRQRRGRET